MNIPNDPVILLSFINMKLRDFYNDLDNLCDDLELNQEELLQKLQMIDYHYNREHNQFI